MTILSTSSLGSAFFPAFSQPVPIKTHGRDNPLIPLPLDFSGLTPFSQKGLKAIQTIPFGQTASYKEIAKCAGNPHAARAIGGVCNRNPFPLVIPCHRIISADHTLGGFAYDLLLKQSLLNFESPKN